MVVLVLLVGIVVLLLVLVLLVGLDTSQVPSTVDTGKLVADISVDNITLLLYSFNNTHCIRH